MRGLGRVGKGLLGSILDCRGHFQTRVWHLHFHCYIIASLGTKQSKLFDMVMGCFERRWARKANLITGPVGLVNVCYLGWDDDMSTDVKTQLFQTFFCDWWGFQLTRKFSVLVEYKNIFVCNCVCVCRGGGDGVVWCLWAAQLFFSQRAGDDKWVCSTLSGVSGLPTECEWGGNTFSQCDENCSMLWEN